MDRSAASSDFGHTLQMGHDPKKKLYESKYGKHMLSPIVSEADS